MYQPDCDPKLVAAIQTVDLNQVVAALDAGASPNCEFDDVTALCHAVWTRCADIVTALLDHGAELVPSGEYERDRLTDGMLVDALVNAATVRDLVIARLLLDRGAPILPHTVPGTAVHIAAQNNDVQMLDLLFQHGGTSTLKVLNNLDDYPLGAAVREKAYEAARFLLQHRANPNHSFVRTPLELAESNQDSKMVSLLKEFGARR